MDFPHKSSVFPALTRPALKAHTHEQADAILRAAEGLGIPAQSFGIYNKVFEFDEILSLQRNLQEKVKEVYSEVCFWAWNYKHTML